MRVLLVDDHELIWSGTHRLLGKVAEDFDWASDLQFKAVLDEPFDLILLDDHLPGTAGLEALQHIQAALEGATICLVSAEKERAHIRAVLDAGAAGFMPKSYCEAEMASALRLVLRQKVHAPAEFLRSEEIVRGHDADKVRSEDLAGFLRSELSARQRQSLGLPLRGLPNKTLARRLQIAEGTTVKVHLSMAYKALGVKNRVGALCRVLQADAAGALEDA